MPWSPEGYPWLPSILTKGIVSFYHRPPNHPLQRNEDKCRCYTHTEMTSTYCWELCIYYRLCNWSNHCFFDWLHWSRFKTNHLPDPSCYPLWPQKWIGIHVIVPHCLSCFCKSIVCVAAVNPFCMTVLNPSGTDHVSRCCFTQTLTKHGPYA